MKLAWISDCHFDFVLIDTVKAFAQQVSRYGADAVLFTGDISNSRTLTYHLSGFASTFPGKIYFTLGNHDLYHSNLGAVLKACNKLCSNTTSNLVFLDYAGVQALSDTTCLVGNMGFYDAKAGSKNSNFVLSDFHLNNDLRSAVSIPKKCKDLAEGMAIQAKADLILAANQYSTVYFGTHVPPFVESSLYEGKMSEPNAQPYFVNVTFGEMLLEVACLYPDVNFKVFCGHTHHAAEYQPLQNLVVYTAYAEYYYPAVWKILEV